MLGNFNYVLDAHEQHGGYLPNRATCSGFVEMINDCNLTEIVPKVHHSPGQMA